MPWATNRYGSSVPGSLEEALAALRSDHDYLMKGDVFTPDLLDTWLDYKKENEADPLVVELIDPRPECY